MATKLAYKPANIKYKRYNVWLPMKSKIAADRVLKRFSRKIRKEDAIKANFTLFMSNNAIPIPNLRITDKHGNADYVSLCWHGAANPRVRDRAFSRLWRVLAALPNADQRTRLETLLVVRDGDRVSPLDAASRSTRFSSGGRDHG